MEQVTSEHFHTHCRDRGSVRGQVLLPGKSLQGVGGAGEDRATLPPLPCAHPSPSRGNPRAVPGRMGYPPRSCGPGEGLQVSICPQASKPCSSPWEHLSLWDGRASLSMLRLGGPTTWVQWVLQLLRLEEVQLLVLCVPAHYHSPSSETPSGESPCVKPHPAPRRLPGASLSCMRERARGQS